MMRAHTCQWYCQMQRQGLCCPMTRLTRRFNELNSTRMIPNIPQIDRQPSNSQNPQSTIIEPWDRPEFVYFMFPSEDFKFFILPPEIRLRIYEYLLISRAPTANPLDARLSEVQAGIDTINNHAPKPQIPRGTKISIKLSLPCPSNPTIYPDILRTNKKVYSEANEILYMHNTFRFGKATHLRNFLHQIGPTNLAHIRELQLWISPEAAIGPWSRALLTLSQQTHSLKILQLEWDESGFGAKRKNFDFMTALIKIRGLEKLVFLESESSGDERKNYWVPYLERKMRIAVEGGMAEKVVEGAVRADAEEVMALEEEIERWVEERGMRKMDDVMPG